ncbi:MAG TPA: hypothetical protein VG963_33445 [Polyangiaceae bacterium]|nr:hypothetical protein [Polyangiaceae bacterium]
MRFTKQDIKHRFGILTLALSLFACGTQANVGSTASHQGDATAQASGAEAAQPVESTYEREARMEALIASRNGTVLPPDPLAQPKTDAPSEVSAKADVTNQASAKEERAAASEAPRHRRAKKARRAKAAEHRGSAEVASTRADAN